MKIEEIPAPTELDHKKMKSKFDSFSELLQQIDSVEDKKKALWKEIYENAVTDREYASIMFIKVYAIVGSSSSENAIHGSTIAKYLERMNRANEQLVRLAELVQTSETKSKNIDPEDVFERIRGR